MEFREWMKSERICRNCGWKGFGREAVLRQHYDSGADFQCPHCEEYFGYLDWPKVSRQTPTQRFTRACKRALYLLSARNL